MAPFIIACLACNVMCKKKLTVAFFFFSFSPPVLRLCAVSIFCLCSTDIKAQLSERRGTLPENKDLLTQEVADLLVSSCCLAELLISLFNLRISEQVSGRRRINAMKGDGKRQENCNFGQKRAWISRKRGMRKGTLCKYQQPHYHFKTLERKSEKSGEKHFWTTPNSFSLCICISLHMHRMLIGIMHFLELTTDN